MKITSWRWLGMAEITEKAREACRAATEAAINCNAAYAIFCEVRNSMPEWIEYMRLRVEYEAKAETAWDILRNDVRKNGEQQEGSCE